MRDRQSSCDAPNPRQVVADSRPVVFWGRVPLLTLLIAAALSAAVALTSLGVFLLAAGRVVSGCFLLVLGLPLAALSIWLWRAMWQRTRACLLSGLAWPSKRAVWLGVIVAHVVILVLPVRIAVAVATTAYDDYMEKRHGGKWCPGCHGYALKSITLLEPGEMRVVVHWPPESVPRNYRCSSCGAFFRQVGRSWTQTTAEEMGPFIVEEAFADPVGRISVSGDRVEVASPRTGAWRGETVNISEYLAGRRIPVQWTEVVEVSRLADIDTRLRGPVSLPSEDDELVLHLAGSAAAVRTYADYTSFRILGYKGESTYARKMESHCVKTCEALLLLRRARASRASYVSEFRLDDRTLAMLPVSLLRVRSTGPAEPARASSKLGANWSDVLRDAVIRKAAGGGIEIRLTGWRLALQVVAFGDIDGDAVEDVVMWRLLRTEDAPYAEYGYVVLKRTEPDGALHAMQIHPYRGAE
jgi:hypothetical protein